jgi:hypothetical protein
LESENKYTGHIRAGLLWRAKPLMFGLALQHAAVLATRTLFCKILINKILYPAHVCVACAPASSITSVTNVIGVGSITAVTTITSVTGVTSVM